MASTVRADGVRHGPASQADPGASNWLAPYRHPQQSGTLMSVNWLDGPQRDGDQMGKAQAMPMFEGQKLVVVGGSSGMGRQTAADVVAAGGSAVIIGANQDRVDDTVQTLAKDGTAYGITADLADRMQAEQVGQQLAADHADATLLVNAAGLFLPQRPRSVLPSLVIGGLASDEGPRDRHLLRSWLAEPQSRCHGSGPACGKAVT
jgi:hypothetical protein